GIVSANMKTSYGAKPVDTASVSLTQEIDALTGRLAENNHDIRAKRRMAEGRKYGKERDDERKLHPCLVAYADLPESEKEYDRATALEALKAIVAAGYQIVEGD